MDPNENTIPSLFSKHIRIIAVVGVLLVILVSIVFANYLLSTRSTSSTQNSTSIPPSGSTSLSPTTNRNTNNPLTLQLQIDEYDMKTTLPTLPSSVPLFRLKSSFNVEEIKQLANKLGLSEIVRSNGHQIIFADKSNPSSVGGLIFDVETGRFKYESYGNTTPALSVAGQSSVATAQSFFQELFPNDTTVTCASTYRVKGISPEIEYVECHRDWQKVGGLPILNAVGVLNIPEETSLSTLSLGKSQSDTPSDPSIIMTSNNTNGKVRPNDFNTITFAVDSTSNRIVSIDSNLRWIDDTQVLSSSRDLSSPQDALNEFINNKADFSLAIPAGKGSVDAAKIYVDGRLKGKKAQVTDYLLAYLEKPAAAAQTYLAPMYIIRGLVTLENGYTMRFIQTVPATTQKLSFLSSSKGEIAGVSSTSDESDRGQKQGTFQLGGPTFTPTPTPCPPGYILNEGSCILIKWGEPQPTTTPPAVQYACDLSQYITFQLPGIGLVGWDGVKTHVFYFISPQGTTFDFSQIRDQFYSAAEKQVVISFSKILELNHRLDALNGKPVTDAQVASAIQESIPVTQSQYPFTASLYTTAYFPALIQGTSLDAALSGVNTDIKPHLSSAFAKFKQVLIAGEGKTQAKLPDLFPGQSLTLFMGVFALQSDPSNNPCPYISGDSPFIFLSTDTPRTFEISLEDVNVSYHFPNFGKEQAWKGTVALSGEIKLDTMQNFSSQSLYYEYTHNSVHLTSAHDIAVSNTKESIDTLTTYIASTLRLSSQESEALRTEVYKITSLETVKKSQFIRVGVASQESINRSLPLLISPQPTVLYRLHLLISPLSKKEFQKYSHDEVSLSLKPIERDGFTVIEIGAR
ncbi:MAG: hypothetical protein Q7S61_05730 [bacterium]|nr:hypothetical protein [bacterium]